MVYANAYMLYCSNQRWHSNGILPKEGVVGSPFKKSEGKRFLPCSNADPDGIGVEMTAQI